MPKRVMPSATEKLTELKEEALAAIEAATTPEALAEVRIKYLGKKGALKKLQQQLFKDADTPAKKKEVGSAFNPIQTALTEAHDARAEKLKEKAPKAKPDIVDITKPGIRPPSGHRHPITQTIANLAAIFRSMGFAVEDGPEIEDAWYGFEALNIPEGHLARDPSDNFVLNHTGLTMRSQTSNCQIRVMMKQKPPVRCVVPGRVYRPDTVDATHHFMFHQIEGLVVDKGVTFADLKHCIDQFLHAFYVGKEFEWRMRPHFFPFTEPSAEVDVRMKGTSNWLEMLGCGMVDPNVLEACEIDPSVYTGYAFGMGVERLAMLRYGIKDIRHFTENDIAFLEQF